jgi:hypothetical protein
MRPSRTVARAALTAAFALAALPGLVGSFEPGASRPVDAALFEHVTLATTPERQGFSPALRGAGPVLLDDAAASAGRLQATDSFAEAGSEPPASLGRRADPNVRAAASSWSWKPPRSTIRGAASFYDFGTTAMRDVPRGTVVVICGAGGCIERVVSDYGPAQSTGRVIDMYRPDFFRICGCGWWSGTTTVTVRVY